MTSRAERQAGFTLIEMTVVVAVMGLLLGLVLIQGRPRSGALQPHTAAVELANALREARARAILVGHDVVFALDLDQRRYQFEDQRPHDLGGGLELSLLGAARGFSEDSNTASVFFSPDGSSSGAQIGLSAQGRHSLITVNWLSGLVTVSDVP